MTIRIYIVRVQAKPCYDTKLFAVKNVPIIVEPTDLSLTDLCEADEVGGGPIVGVGVIIMGGASVVERMVGVFIETDDCVEFSLRKEEGSRTDVDSGGSAVFIGLMPAMPSKVEDVNRIECFDIEAS